jgi:hypothetical protein
MVKSEEATPNIDATAFTASLFDVDDVEAAEVVALDNDPP